MIDLPLTKSIGSQVARGSLNTNQPCMMQWFAGTGAGTAIFGMVPVLVTHSVTDQRNVAEKTWPVGIVSNIFQPRVL
jgi:hypothetical protein